MKHEFPGSPAGLDPYTGSWETPQVVHLLKRTLFGATVQDINYFKGLSMSQAVDEILLPTAVPSVKPLNNYGNDPTGVAQWQTWVGTGITYVDEGMNTGRLRSMQAWWMGQLLSCGRSIHEKMTLFWHNHFAPNALPHLDIPAELWYNQYLTLRKYALGNYPALMKAITLDPAMLLMLNGSTNTKTSPNENFGRELQELYTIGKGSGSHYEQSDVAAAARVLTGHTVDLNYNYLFQPGDHDDTNKTFSVFYNNKIVTGYSGTPGVNELDILLNMLFATDESAKFLCRKLYNFFVYYKIDDTIEANVITPLASVLRSSGYNMTATLSVLFKSQHFYDLVNSGACIIKSPLDMLIGLCREFQVKMPTDAKGQYSAWSLIANHASDLQQEVLAIPLVAGWDAYHQSPQYHELWINSVTYSLRNFLTDQLIGTGDMLNGTNLQIDAVAFAKSLPAPHDPNQLIIDSLNVLLRPPLSDSSTTLLKQSILLGGGTTDLYWTNAWLSYLAAPTDMTAFGTVDQRLRELYKYIMDLPEYHLS
ncbi:MAG: DUF1800 domain-containing protein [Bacteroidetes bacterium]|nr:DUF1800 domain-containing protein [Bacteroidota bacterium]